MLRALQLSSRQQADELTRLFGDATLDEDERVVRVMALYDAIGLKPSVEEAIGEEFRAAGECLGRIDADEARKAPLRELTATLVGRKK